MPLEVTVQVTVKPARFEISRKRINDLLTPLMIEWGVTSSKKVVVNQ
jgi:hypothetical protein